MLAPQAGRGGTKRPSQPTAAEDLVDVSFMARVVGGMLVLWGLGLWVQGFLRHTHMWEQAIQVASLQRPVASSVPYSGKYRTVLTLRAGDKFRKSADALTPAGDALTLRTASQVALHSARRSDAGRTSLSLDLRTSGSHAITLANAGLKPQRVTDVHFEFLTPHSKGFVVELDGWQFLGYTEHYRAENPIAVPSQKALHGLVRFDRNLHYQHTPAALTDDKGAGDRHAVCIITLRGTFGEVSLMVTALVGPPPKPPVIQRTQSVANEAQSPREAEPKLSLEPVAIAPPSLTPTQPEVKKTKPVTKDLSNGKCRIDRTPHHNKWLGGYAGDEGRRVALRSFEEAAMRCLQTDDCGGITQVGQEYELRIEQKLKPSSAGETSFLKKCTNR